MLERRAQVLGALGRHIALRDARLSDGRAHHHGEQEKRVWEAVSGLLTDPERLRTGLDAMIELERAGVGRDPDKELQLWAGKLAELQGKRERYQEMAADDLITFDELRARLTELDSVRKTVERELTVMRSRKDQLYELERDRDALLESYARRTPDDLDALTAEERHQVYKMLAPKVVAMPDESLEVSGAFGDGLGVCQSDTERSRPSTRKTRPCTATFSTASGHSSRRWRA